MRRFIRNSFIRCLFFVFISTLSGCNSSDENSVPTSENPLLGDSKKDCKPFVCEPWNFETDGDYKDVYEKLPACELPPQETGCKLKSLWLGKSWPSKAEIQIIEASEKAGGFTEEQKTALRCLAYLEPSGEFKVSTWDMPTGTPQRIQLQLSLKLPEEPEKALESFLSEYGDLIGEAYHITSDYAFETKTFIASGYGMSGGISVYMIAKTYKGFPVRNVRLNFDLIPATDEDPNTGQHITCKNKYDLAYIDGEFDRGIESLDLDDENMISAETAIEKALEKCGSDCGKLPAEENPFLYIKFNKVMWETRVGCPSGCKSYPSWTCTYQINAHTGIVESGGIDCCVDCWYE